jgi:hypothetical protein
MKHREFWFTFYQLGALCVALVTWIFALPVVLLQLIQMPNILLNTALPVLLEMGVIASLLIYMHELGYVEEMRLS